MNPPSLPQSRKRTPNHIFFTLIFLLALLLASCEQTNPTTTAPGEEPAFTSLSPVSSASGSKALVICPPTDSGGCDRIAAQLGLASHDAILFFGGGVDKAYAELRGMPLAQLQQYSVVFVPSLANAPYDLLREDAVQTRLQQILSGRVIVWSGTPDRGTLRGASAGKLTLIENLARWAAAGNTTNGSASLVVLQDFSDAHTDGRSPRYDWVQGIAGVRIEPDTTARSYDQVETNTSNPAAESIVGALAYNDMASFGLTLPQPFTEIGAWGQDVRGKRVTRGPIVLGIVIRSPAACETVGSVGGEFTYQSGNVVLTFPEGALTDDWCVSVEHANAEGTGYVQNTAFSFGPSGLSFATPAVLSVAYAESNIPDGGSESDLAIHTFIAGAWTEVPGSVVDAANNTVTTESFDQPNRYAIFLRGLTPPPAGGGSGKPAEGVAVAPASSNVAAGGLQTLTATVIDKQGNPLSGKIVTWSSTNGGSFSTTTGTTDAIGVATTDFTAATMAATQHVVTATAESKTGTSTLTVIAGPASQLAFTEQPSDAQAGAAISPAVEVTAQDAYGNTVTEYGADVSLAITTGTGATGATLGGIATIAATAGVATFTDPSITTAGTGYTLTATSDGLTGDISSTFDIAPAAPASLTVAPSTATIEAGATQLFTTMVKDKHDNVIANASVNWSSSNAAVATVAPATGTSTTATAASATPAATVVTITATSVADASVSGSADLTVNPVPIPCDDAGWRVELSGPAAEPFFAQGSAFEAAWTHESGDPVCGAPIVVVEYAWTMNDGPLLSSSSTAEIPALGYAGGIYAASHVETVVELAATVGTSPAVTAARVLRPRPTTPIGITALYDQAPCQDTYCELATHAVFENPDGDDEALVFEWLCSASGGVAGETYCNSSFSPNTDYFLPNPSEPEALLNGRVGVCYTIAFRVGKVYDDTQWSLWIPGPVDRVTYPNSGCGDYGHIIHTTRSVTLSFVTATVGLTFRF